MSEIEGPELHVIRFSDEAGADWRAESQRLRHEARRRYVEHLSAALPSVDRATSPVDRAAAVLDVLTEWTDVESGDPCTRACHPSLPSGDLHDFGFACSCRKTAEERRQESSRWLAEMDAFWSSPEGERIRAAREAEDQELVEGLFERADVEVRMRGGWAEQWRGIIDGHSFYFRERHHHWRLELDLAPTGDHSTVWVGGDLDDEIAFEQREIEAGEVIAEGTTGVAGYGDSPLARLQFIVGVVRSHLRGEDCTVHTVARAATEAALGFPMAWCPACGAERHRVSRS